MAGLRYMSIMIARVPLRVSASKSKGAFVTLPGRPGKPMATLSISNFTTFSTHRAAALPASISALRAA